MREKILTAAAVTNLVLAGALLGGFATWSVVRLSNVETAHANLVGSLNQQVLPQIQEQLKIATAGKTPVAAKSK